MMLSVSEQTTETTDRARAASTARALRWFKLMAIVAGLAMFVLIAEMVLKYGFDNEVLTWWSPVHGVIFMVFVFTVWNLGTLLRWSIGRMVAIVLGACIPLVAFWIERRVAAEVEPTLAGSLAT
jgi:integral membrane protein